MPKRKATKTTKRKKTKKRKTTKKRRGSRKTGEQPAHFKAPLQCSPPLSLLLSNGETDRLLLQRSEATKRVWAYAKANGLQDSTDGRRILCDQAMRKVFGVPDLTLLTMAKALSPHLSSTTAGASESTQGKPSSSASSSSSSASGGSSSITTGN